MKRTWGVLRTDWPWDNVRYTNGIMFHNILDWTRANVPGVPYPANCPGGLPDAGTYWPLWIVERFVDDNGRLPSGLQEIDQYAQAIGAGSIQPGRYAFPYCAVGQAGGMYGTVECPPCG